MTGGQCLGGSDFVSRILGAKGEKKKNQNEKGRREAEPPTGLRREGGEGKTTEKNIKGVFLSAGGVFSPLK